jgi:hypothetical protein
VTAQMVEATSVYTYFDVAGRLIYVGITSRGITRQLEHNRHAEWWRFVVRQEVEHYGTRTLAEVRETELIRVQHPPFNTAQNDRWQVVRPAYLALRSVEQQYAEALAGLRVRCGHCESCRYRHRYGESFDFGECRQGSQPFDGYLDPCEVCGSLACLYVDGQAWGHVDGYTRGYDAGEKRSAIQERGSVR